MNIKNLMAAAALFFMFSPFAYGAAITVEEAVDDTSLSFTLTGDANWYGQNTDYYFGNDAAESGDINDMQASNMDVTVSGVTAVGFYWSVSSEPGYDFLVFSIDGMEQERISGTTGWTQKTYNLDTGAHVLSWNYYKDGSLSVGSDCGRVDNIFFNVQPTVTPTAVIVPIPEAVDDLSLSFTLSGAANWYGQNITSFSGGDAAQSGDINDSETSVMETTVSGYGGVSFYWRVSSEQGWDFLRFYIDGVMQNEISGTSGTWVQRTYGFDAGTHVLNWEYSKDSVISAGQDCGWVDRIMLMGTPTPTPTVTLSMTGTPPTPTVTPTATVVVTYDITPGTGSAWELAVDPAGFGEKYFHTSAVYNNSMWIIAGFGTGPGPVSNDVWKSNDGILWTQESASAGFAARMGHATVEFNNRLWVIGGGEGGGKLFGDIWSSADGVNWTMETSMTALGQRIFHSSVVFNGRIWVIGGVSSMMGSPASEVWSSLDGVNWTLETASAAFPPRMIHSSVVHDNRIWIINGFDGSTYYNDAWYSYDGVNWTQATAAAPYTARYSNTLLSYQGKMWMIGGYDNSMIHFVNDVWSSSDGINWTQETAAANFSGRAGHSSVVFGNKMWVIAGFDGTASMADVWYSPQGPLNTPTISPTGTISATITPSITGTPPTETPTPTVTVTHTPGGPVCADALGNTVVHASSTSFAGSYVANIRYMPQSGNVKALVVHVGAVSGGSLRAAIYTDNAGVPGNLIVETAELFPAATGWFRMPVTDTNLTAGNYWIAVQSGAGVDLSYDVGSYTGGYDTQAYGPFADPWITFNPVPFSWSVYAEYCPGPAFTATATITGTPPAETATQTVSQEATLTSTETNMETATYTVSSTATLTVTGTATETITGTPPTETVTPTVTATSTDTAVLTPTRTATVTITRTATRTPTPGNTGTNTRTITVTASQTVTQTATRTQTCSTPITVTYTITSTATRTATMTATRTITAAPTLTMTYTFTPTFTITATPAGTSTPTIVMTETVFEVRDPVIYPNPVNPADSGSFYAGYYLTRDVASARIKVYTDAFRKIADLQISGADNAGPKLRAVPVSTLGIPASGVYYYIIEADGPPGRARSKAGVMIILK